MNPSTSFNNNTSEPLVYNIRQTAAILMCSVSLCYKLARAGKIPGVLFWGEKRLVVSKVALHEYLRTGESQ